MESDLFQPHTISYVLAWIFSIPLFIGLIATGLSLLFEMEDIPALFRIWFLLCLIICSPFRYIYLQIIFATVYPCQSISAFLSTFYLAIFVSIAFSILWAIGILLPILVSFFLTFGSKENPPAIRMLFGAIATPIIFLIGNFLFFTTLQYASYSTHSIKAENIMRASNGPAEYFFKYVVEFGTPLSYPQFAYDIGLQNLTNKEKLRLHVASTYLSDSEFSYYIHSEFPKYIALRNVLEKNQAANKVPKKWPEMTPEEANGLSVVSSKMMKEPLSNEDLEAVSLINKQYMKRVGRSMGEEEAVMAYQYSVTLSQYRYELCKCLLKSVETKEPFVSNELNRISSELRQFGIKTKAEINSDYRAIKSAATGEQYVDAKGKERYPPIREDILIGLKETEMIKDNVVQFVKAITE